MTVEWEHRPDISLVSAAWTVQLVGDGSLIITCVGNQTTHSMRMPHDVVLDLGNAVRRNEVRLVRNQQREDKAT